MAAIIGNNPLVCYLHDNFTTEDINEWNQHCLETGHTMSGETACIDCGVSLRFENVPFQPITPTGHNIRFRCDTCKQKEIDRLQNGGI